MRGTLTCHSKRYVVAMGFLLALGAGPSMSLARDRSTSKMRYQVGWASMSATTGAINKQAEDGWKLRSASMTQCPTREPAKTKSCVMIVMEKEDK